MKFRTILTVLLAATLIFTLAACAKDGADAPTAAPTDAPTETTALPPDGGVVELTLTGDGVVCDSDAVYAANDILYYEAGHGAGYGEGTADEAHTAEEAAAHTVVHITAPGTYRVTGELARGQLFVDLGENAERDENARVTLILDGVNISSTVAPAVLFYRVYECADKETFTLTPDLTNAGAVVVLQNENNVSGSHVAELYREGTTDTLCRLDGAFYSRQSLRIEGDGTLNLAGSNEGLDTELHLQIDGGEINIHAQDDGVNANEDGVSVVTVNGGSINISGGNGSEGDGIDANGAIVVNGGTLYASANPQTGDGGIDAELGIYLNGGTVIATGSRNDAICADSKQVLMDMTFAQPVQKGAVLALLSGETQVFTFTAEREYSALVISAPSLQLGVPYRLTLDGVKQQHGGMVGGMQPGGPGSGTIPNPPDGKPPEVPATDAPDANELPIVGIELPPDTFTPSDITPPSGDRPEPPSGGRPISPDDRLPADVQEVSEDFTVTKEHHTFRNITAAN